MQDGAYFSGVYELWLAEDANYGQRSTWLASPPTTTPQSTRFVVHSFFFQLPLSTSNLQLLTSNLQLLFPNDFFHRLHHSIYHQINLLICQVEINRQANFA